MPVPVNDVSLQVILFLRTHFFCEKTNRHLLFLQKSFSTGALFRTHGDKKADVRFCFVHLSMNICFHRKRFTNLSSRFPDSQIFTAAAPSHAFRTMAFLQLTLPAYSDRIAREFHPIPFYPGRYRALGGISNFGSYSISTQRVCQAATLPKSNKNSTANIGH